MHNSRRNFVLGSFIASTGFAHMLRAQETYPNRPIRLITPSTTAGTAFARKINDHLAQILGQPLVIESRPGAQATIAPRLAAKAPADGYTLLQGSNSTHSAGPYLFKNLGYDPVKDFVPIAHWCINPLLLVVRTDLELRDVNAFSVWAKANSGKINYGVGNTAGILTGTMLQQEIGFQAVAVNYPSTAPAIVDLAAGRLDFMVTDPLVALPHVQSGRLRILGISSRQRLPLLPDVVPLADQGLPQFEYASWIGTFAPTGVPDEIVRMLRAAYAKALAEPDVVEFISAQGAIPMQSSIEDFEIFLAEQSAMWKRLVQAAGLPVQ